jgi:hypothetical protein
MKTVCSAITASLVHLQRHSEALWMLHRSAYRLNGAGSGYLRSSHRCARIGGEEFLVVLGNAATEAGHEFAETIRVATAAEPVQTSAEQYAAR